MIYNENGHRFYNYDEWETLIAPPYNYEKNGLLKHIISHVITDSKNNVLQAILKYYEKSLIIVMKYIDILKHFKNYHWKNR